MLTTSVNMMDSLFLVIVFLLAGNLQSAQGADWSYKGAHGADSWPTDFPDSCSGKKQSPIDLTSSKVVYDSSLEKFSFSGFKTTSGVTMQIVNNGHTVRVTYTSGHPNVSGGSLTNRYRVEQFHFHWGSSDTIGSEHTVDGKSFPSEVHIVCSNTKYSNVSFALTQTDGLAVLGYFFEIASDENPTVKKIVSALSGITTAGEQDTLDAFALDDLIANSDDYYRYQGGLTTPNCNEVVTWTLFEDTIKISRNQLEAFRALKDSHSEALVDNFRPVQDLNDRTIRASFFDNRFSSASGPVFNSLAIVFSLLLSVWSMT